MIRLASLSILVVLFAFLAGCSDKKLASNEWFTSPGHVLEYESVVANVGKQKCVVTYSAGKFKGVRCVKASRSGGALPMTLDMYYSIDDGQVNWLGLITSDPSEPTDSEKVVATMSFKPYIPILPAQPKVDDSLSGAILTFAGETAVDVCSVESRVECMETITVPAGTFECLKVVVKVTEVRGSRSEQVMTYWFAKGVGIVMSTMLDGEQQETLKLTSVR